jgi:hypothetical protein
MDESHKQSRSVILEFLKEKANKAELYFKFKRFSAVITKWQREWRNRKAED